MLGDKFPHEPRVDSLVDAGVEHLHSDPRLELPLVRMCTVVEGGVLRVALQHPALQEKFEIRH